VEQNPIRIAEILLGLKDVNLIGVEDLGDEDSKTPLRVHIECVWVSGQNAQSVMG
jgi:hypothetical protein